MPPSTSLIPSWVPFYFLPIQKPGGPTSHDVVAKIRRCIGRQHRVGHMGTLDPFASGVLLLGVGKATRFAADTFELEKCYRGRITLGRQTDTLDATGETVKEAQVASLEQSELDRLAEAFMGLQKQMPPAFSAKKVDGKRSYKLARQKKEPNLKAQDIFIRRLELTRLGPISVGIDVVCSTGTYVRSLARDIAQQLGTCGFLSELERYGIGSVDLRASLPVDRVSMETLMAYQIPVARVLPKFPEILLPDSCYRDLHHGRPHRVAEPLPAEFLGIVGQGPAFRAVFRCGFDPDRLTIVPKMVCFDKG